MRGSNRRQGGRRPGVCETADCTTRSVLAPAYGNCTQASQPRSGMRTPPRADNVERLAGSSSEPDVPLTPSIPSSIRGGTVTLPCCDLRDERAVNGAPVLRTPDVPGKRAAADSRRRFRSGGGKSRSHRKRWKGGTVSTQGLPGLTGKLDDEEYRHQQRVAREEKLARRAQEIADDEARKDEASRKRCPSRRRSTGGVGSPWSSIFRVDPYRRQSALAAPARHQARIRRKQCGQAICGWTPSAPGFQCVACPGEVVHATTVALCAACHKFLPDGKAAHFGLERQHRARTFMQKCQAGGAKTPGAVVQTFEPNSDCLWLGEDCFHAIFESEERKANGRRRCDTCGKQQRKYDNWFRVEKEDQDGVTVDDVGELSNTEACLSCFECRAYHHRNLRRRKSIGEVAGSSTSCADVLGGPRLSSMERVWARVEDAVASGGIVDWRKASAKTTGAEALAMTTRGRWCGSYSARSRRLPVATQEWCAGGEGSMPSGMVARRISSSLRH